MGLLMGTSAICTTRVFPSLLIGISEVYSLPILSEGLLSLWEEAAFLDTTESSEMR